MTARINTLVRDCETRGAKVRYVFPPLPGPDYRQHQAELDRFAEDFLKQCAIRALNRPADAILPWDRFYDTNYHLTDAAARQRSIDLLVRLQADGVVP
jgi:hypothetical protein